MYNFRILLSLAIILPGLAFGTLLAGERDELYVPRLIDVPIDNEFIQSYRGRLGRWVRAGSGTMQSLAEEFQTSVEEIREINDDFEGARSMFFIPMGLDTYNDLVQEGKGRRVLKIDPRRLLWPVDDPKYTSRYGMRRGQNHNGLDLACPPNTVVLAVDDGVVTHSSWFGALGQAVAIRHENGLVTWYGHNNMLFLKVGESVKRGQAIAFSGNTGRSTGPHVHFEVRFQNIAMNPEDFLELGLVQPGVVYRESTPMDFSNIRVGESVMADRPNERAKP